VAELRPERRLDQPRDPRLRLPRLDPETFGRLSEGIARYMGTAKFLVYMTAFILVWFGWNTLAPRNLRFDPYTFTFLTLLLSLQASYAAPLILLAQNRQADRDRLAMEEDRRRAAMQKADTEYLAREIASLRVSVGEVATRDFLRSELNRLSEELDETAERRHRTERKQQRRLAKRQTELVDALAVEEPDDGEAESERGAESKNSTDSKYATESQNWAESGNDRPRKGRRAPQGARRATPSE
jgi:uncharacterized membrane protein